LEGVVRWNAMVSEIILSKLQAEVLHGFDEKEKLNGTSANYRCLRAGMLMPAG
jgi:hypothetical protein